MTNADITYDRPEVIGNLISVSGSWSASSTGREVHLDLSPYMKEVLSVFIAPETNQSLSYSRFLILSNVAGNGGLTDNGSPDGFFPEIKPLIDKDDPAKVTFFSNYVAGIPTPSVVEYDTITVDGTWSTGSKTVTHTAIDETISGPLKPGMLVWEQDDEFSTAGRLIDSVADSTHFDLTHLPDSHSNSGNEIAIFVSGAPVETKDMVLVSNNVDAISTGNFIVIGRK